MRVCCKVVLLAWCADRMDASHLLPCFVVPSTHLPPPRSINQLRGLFSDAIKEFATAALEQEASLRASLRSAAGVDLASKATLDGVDVAGKVVFVRADLDVPLRQVVTKPPKQPKVKRVRGAPPPPPPPPPTITWEVADDAKVAAATATLQQLIKGNAAVVVVAAHLGQGAVPSSYPSADGAPCRAVSDVPSGLGPVHAVLQVRVSPCGVCVGLSIWVLMSVLVSALVCLCLC